LVDSVSVTKVCVIGIEVEGKFYPAIGVTVTSKTLKPEQLPKATFMKKSAL